jgi:hypothetical protein
MEEYDEPELIEPEDFLAGDPFPPDARRMGIDHWSDEAALIALAANLDPAKPFHKVVAWVMLTMMLVTPAMTLWYEIRMA